MRQPYRAKLFLVGTLDKPQTRIIYNQIQNGDVDSNSNQSNSGSSSRLVLSTSPRPSSNQIGYGAVKIDVRQLETPRAAVETGTTDISKHAPSLPTKTVYRKKGNFPEEKQKIIAHASRISNNDLDFIATLDKENAGTWDVNITSKKNKNGTYDKGLCQLNSQYYSHLYKDKNWKNPEWQVNRCWELYSAWKKLKILHKRLFAYPKRHASKLNFELTQ